MDISIPQSIAERAEIMPFAWAVRLDGVCVDACGNEITIDMARNWQREITLRKQTLAADAIRKEMAGMSVDVLVEMANETGLTDLTPFMVLAEAAMRAMAETPTAGDRTEPSTTPKVA